LIFLAYKNLLAAKAAPWAEITRGTRASPAPEFRVAYAITKIVLSDFQRNTAQNSPKHVISREKSVFWEGAYLLTGGPSLLIAPTRLSEVTPSNLNRFSKFFHW